jgi:phage replication O-like protein O
MASPQKENGYTPIANEIMEALCRTRIPGEDRQVLDAILRKTYGWSKCEDHISMGQIANLTGLKRQNVGRSIKALRSRNIITVIKNDDSYLNLLKFNKDHESWVSSKMITPKPVIKNDDRSVIKADDKTVIKSDAHKRKKAKKQYLSDSDFNLFYQCYPKHEGKKKALDAWKKIISENGLLNIIFTAIENQKAHKEHLKSTNQFCPEWPLPATWLNGRRWEDEVLRAASSPGKVNNSSCPKCGAQIPPQDRRGNGCIRCENEMEARA